MPLLDSITSLFSHRDGNTATKPLAQSWTVQGMVITIAFTLLHAKGIPLDKDQTVGIYTEAHALWPQLIIMGGAFSTIIGRIVHTDFSVSRFMTPHFWAGLVTSLLALAQALGVDTTGMEHLAADTGDMVTRLIGLGASVYGVVGVIRSGKPIQSLRALPA